MRILICAVFVYKNRWSNEWVKRKNANDPLYPTGTPTRTKSITQIGGNRRGNRTAAPVTRRNWSADRPPSGAALIRRGAPTVRGKNAVFSAGFEDRFSAAAILHLGSLRFGVGTHRAHPIPYANTDSTRLNSLSNIHLQPLQRTHPENRANRRESMLKSNRIILPTTTVSRAIFFCTASVI